MDASTLYKMWQQAGGVLNGVYFHTANNNSGNVIKGRTFRALEPQNSQYCPKPGSEMDSWMSQAKQWGNIGVSLDCECEGADYAYMKAFYAAAQKFELVLCICPQATLTAGGEPYWNMGFADASRRCGECGDIIFGWQYGSFLPQWQSYVAQTRAAGVSKQYICMPDGMFREGPTDDDVCQIVNWCKQSGNPPALFYPHAVSKSMRLMAQLYR